MENDKLDVATEVATVRAYAIDFTEIIKSKDEWERALDSLSNYFNINLMISD